MKTAAIFMAAVFCFNPNHLIQIPIRDFFDHCCEIRRLSGADEQPEQPLICVTRITDLDQELAVHVQA
jgi:hypothetical protein